MDIKIDPEQIQGLVEKAILDSIDQSARDTIVAAAIKHLMTPEKPAYGAGPAQSPLEKAFEGAIHFAARSIVEEQIKTDPGVQKALLDLVSAPIAQICENNYDGLPEKIGAAIGDAVAEWLRARR